MTVSKNHFRSFIAEDATTIIAASGTTSAEIDLSGTTLCGIYIPSAFTGTSISFQAATVSGGTFVSVRDGAGNAVSKTVAPSQYIKLDPTDFVGVRYLKVVSGSTEAAARTLTLAARPI